MKNESISPYVPLPATLRSRQKLSDMVTLYEFSLDNGCCLEYLPGQFIELSVFGVGEAPFSLSSAPLRGHPPFEIAVRAIGSVTSALERLRVGAKVGVRGPYGSFFPVGKFAGHDVLFVAGGLGLIPLRSLLGHMLGQRDDFGDIIVLVGTRHPRERIFVDLLKELDLRPDILFMETVDVPDDTWRGNVGVITSLLPRADIQPERTCVVMVGPPSMYPFVLEECRKLGIGPERTYISLERHMKCGLGKCGHCRINDVRCCIEGPVFRSTDIQGLSEAI